MLKRTMNRLYTIAEISRETRAPESTLRSWRDRYPEFIKGQGRGRTRRYTQRDREVFLAVQAFTAEGKTAEEIAEELQRQFTPILDASAVETQQRIAEESKDLLEPTGKTVLHMMLNNQRFALENQRQMNQILERNNAVIEALGRGMEGFSQGLEGFVSLMNREKKLHKLQDRLDGTEAEIDRLRSQLVEAREQRRGKSWLIGLFLLLSSLAFVAGLLLRSLRLPQL